MSYGPVVSRCHLRGLEHVTTNRIVNGSIREDRGTWVTGAVKGDITRVVWSRLMLRVGHMATMTTYQKSEYESYARTGIDRHLNRRLGVSAKSVTPLMSR